MPDFRPGCDFMMGLAKPKQCTKFEMASFSHCVNIEEEHQILGSFPGPGPRPLFSACDFMMGLGKPQLRAKFEVPNPSRCRNIIGNPKFCGASLA